MNKNLDWWFILLACMGFSVQAFGQSGEVSQEGYYVVINAYAQSREQVANSYYEEIRRQGDEVHYAYVRSKQMYFVYTHFHRDFREAIADMRQTRKDPRFPEAWVFVSGDHQVNELDIVKQPEVVEVVQTTEPIPDKSPVADPPKNLTASQDEIVLDEAALEDLDRRLEPPANINQLVFILSNARNNQEVTGDVQIIDTERAKLIGVQNSGEIRAIGDPDNGSGQLTLLCDVFGYRKIQKEVNYYGLDEHEDVQKLEDYYVVFFDLVRYHKGDIATMYNVYYFNDAAIMRPESRFEVNSLLAMMRENPNYRIRIHGHTNGNRRGKIISMGTSDNFFDLDEENKDGSGSAKMLSRRRAELIRDYLISQGIDADRMEIKAWGGRRMLYDKNSPMAKKNVRVEIEILED